jgi:hypothetical protein
MPSAAAFRWPQICRFVGKDKRGVRAQLRNGGQSNHRRYAGNRLPASIIAFALQALQHRGNPPYQTVSIGMAFRDSKPKLLCSERVSPRTETIEEVTSTAQIAICTTSNASRTVIRRPTLPVEPDLTIS